MSQFQNFTSLPPEQEAQFIVYEEKQSERLKSGMTIGTIAGIFIGVLLVGIFLAVEPDHHNPMAEAPAKAQTQAAPAAAPKPMPVETTIESALTTDIAATAPAADPAATTTPPAEDPAATTKPPADPATAPTTP